MVRRQLGWPVAALLLACGSQTPPSGGAPPGQGATTPPQVQAGPGETGALGDPPDLGPLPMALPDHGARSADAPPRREGTAPAIAALDAAEQAAREGWYAEAERFFRAAAFGGRDAARALLGAARVELETGRLTEAADTAAQAARTPAQRVAAETLRGEALLAAGRLDDAERALVSVADERGALRANVLLGNLLSQRGRAAEAQPRFMRLIEAYNDETITGRDAEGLAYVAMAARGLGSVHDANDAFRESTRADARRVETQLEWAELFLEKYDAGHAEESVRAALAVNPSSARAHALMARIRLEQSFDFAAARAYVDRALEIDPGLVAAHVTRAGMELRDMEIEAADRHLDRALQTNAEHLEALSVRAAVRFLADDARGFATAKQEVLRRNRRYTRMYSIIGEYADWEHRYPEIVQMAREAVALDPGDALAHATLGLNLLRMGEEADGLAALREAWQRDRFNVHVFNTLNLYDEVIPQQYEELTRGPLVFRMHREERPVLERYVPPTIERAYDDMRRRYGLTPQGPVRMELFADMQHFSVRTTGLPNLGVQGVCFGKVVTALSPRGGPFNWGQITWHELAHVFHIQLSRNRVPRWFTEGLAEYETIVARPEWRREHDHELYQALRGGRLPALRHMNRAFTHARSAQDMLVAYYASSMIVVYLVERWGFDKAPQMLREWGAGRRSEDVIQRVLGVSIDELDRDFRAHTMRRLAARAGDFSVDFGAHADLEPVRAQAAAAGADAGKQAALAAALLAHGQADEAAQVAERAVGLAPSEPTARFVLATITLGRGDAAGAETHLRALLTGGRDGYDVRLMLARTAMARRDQAAVRQELEAASRIDPDRSEAWMGLSAIAREANDADLRLRVVERLADIDQHGREAWSELLSLLAERGRWADVVRRGESALYLDPHSPEVHRLLAEGYVQTGRPAEGLAELDVALLAQPERPGLVHLGRARALAALGRRREARQAADEAARADPSLAEQARSLGGR